MHTRIATSTLSTVSPTDLDHASLSLSALASLPMSPCEATYFTTLRRVIASAYDRPVETYTTFVTLYNTPSRWTHDEFQAFIDPRNAVAQILLAHFIAVQAILTPILYLERVGFQGVDAPTCVLGWIEGIGRNLEGGWREYVEWPRQVARWPFVRFLGVREEDGEGCGEEGFFDEEAFAAALEGCGEGIVCG